MKPKIIKYKQGEYKFIARLYEDGSGDYEVLEKNRKMYGDDKYHQIACEEDGNLDDWMDRISKNIAEQNMIYDFLEDCLYSEHLK